MMKKGWKIAIICISAALLWLGILLGGYYGCASAKSCAKKWFVNHLAEQCGPADTQKDGIFYYRETNSYGVTGTQGSTSCVEIMYLSSKAEGMNTIIVPETIDGHVVTELGYQAWGIGFMWEYRSFPVDWPDSMKNLYLPKTYLSSFGNGNGKVFFADLIHISAIENDTCTYYVSRSLAYKIDRYNLSNGTNITYRIANIEYMVDSKTYFIADYDEGSLIDFEPPAPTKTGCTFEGWCKDEAQINKWDFASDTVGVPEGELTMKLYAKWKVVA